MRIMILELIKFAWKAKILPIKLYTQNQYLWNFISSILFLNDKVKKVIQLIEETIFVNESTDLVAL